jgi:hypothetical protein
MALSSIIRSLPGAIAGEDLTAAQYRFARLDTTVGSKPFTIDRAVAAGATVGVIYMGAPNGRAVQVVTEGIAKVIAGATITIGQNVDSDANGAAVVSAGSGIIAMTAGVAGQIIEVKLR